MYTPATHSSRPRSSTVAQRHLVVAIPFAAAVAIGGATLLAGAQTGAPAGGLFTDAQATRGETIYGQSCASCHGASLSGGSAPSLVGPRFEASWSDPRVTLDDLFFIQRTTMPPRSSGALTDGDHADVFAFILKRNGFTAGSAPLAPESGQLKLAHLRGSGPRAPRRPAAP